jgi:hypothetical protein
MSLAKARSLPIGKQQRGTFASTADAYDIGFMRNSIIKHFHCTSSYQGLKIGTSLLFKQVLFKMSPNVKLQLNNVHREKWNTGDDWSMSRALLLIGLCLNPLGPVLA